jgi:hypothetical protein
LTLLTRIKWPYAAAVVTVAVPLLIRGGFTTTSRSLFVGVAALSVAATLMRDERAMRSFAREPAILSLLGLAALAVVSAAWTTGDASDAVRWGLVIAAYGATALVAAQAAREQGVAAIAIAIAALAAIEAAVGLIAAGIRVEPFAERIGGSWRPGGTLEYPPALALVQISALPVLLRGMASSRRLTSFAAAGGAALAGGVIALAGSRTEIALAVVVLVMAVVLADRAIHASRPQALLCVLIPLGAGAATRLALGGYAFPGATGGDAARLLALAAIVAAVTLAWALVRRWAWSQQPLHPPTGRRGRHPLSTAITIGIAGLATLAILAATQRSSGPWTEPASGFTHGRSDQWEAAVDTALDHPVTGAGAEAYLQASAADQGSQVSRYAHDLPLEAWAELGPLGLALVLSLGASVGLLLWRIRGQGDAWLVAPAAAAFLLANLVDWPWHLAGAGALWAAALGACVALDRSPLARGGAWLTLDRGDRRGGEGSREDHEREGEDPDRHS